MIKKIGALLLVVLTMLTACTSNLDKQNDNKQEKTSTYTSMSEPMLSSTPTHSSIGGKKDSPQVTPKASTGLKPISGQENKLSEDEAVKAIAEAFGLNIQHVGASEDKVHPGYYWIGWSNPSGGMGASYYVDPTTGDVYDWQQAKIFNILSSKNNTTPTPTSTIQQNTNMQLTPEEIIAAFEGKKPLDMKKIWSNLGVTPSKYIFTEGMEANTIEQFNIPVSSSVLSITNSAKLGYEYLFFKKDGSNYKFVGHIDFPGHRGERPKQVTMAWDNTPFFGFTYTDGTGTGFFVSNEDWYTFDRGAYKKILSYPVRYINAQSPMMDYYIHYEAKANIQSSSELKANIIFEIKYTMTNFLRNKINVKNGEDILNTKREYSLIYNKEAKKFVPSSTSVESNSDSILNFDFAYSPDELLKNCYDELKGIVLEKPQNPNRIAWLKEILGKCKESKQKNELLLLIENIKP